MKNPCFLSAYNTIKDHGYEDQIFSVLYLIFGISEKYNLIITEAESLPPLDDGLIPDAITHFHQLPDNTMEITITLNSGALVDATQEYLAATLYHEAIHAILDANGVKPGDDIQHPIMAESYVDKIREALHDAYPSLETVYLESLSWEGLQLTKAFKSTFDSAKQNEIITNNNYQHAGNFGTTCHSSE